MLVRLGVDGFTARDLAAALAAPVVLVVASGLGTLNHTALTVEALRASGVDCAGLVIGSWPQEPDLAERCNREDLVSVSGVPPSRGNACRKWGGASVREFARTASITLGELHLTN